MQAADLLAGRFEEHRSHLRAVAYRMLGSMTEADDAVQEAWLRLSRAGPSEVANLRAWLTTVVARVCLDMLRTRTSRREAPMDAMLAEPVAGRDSGGDPQYEAVQADSVGLALLVVLDTLAPAERLAFVLHDMFGITFDEIASVLARSPAAARQLASRARRRVQGAASEDACIEVDRTRQHAVVSAFLAASRNGDFEALVALLHPDVVLRTDSVAAQTGATEARGAHAVAESFAGRARAAQFALVNGAAGLVWAPGGSPRVVFDFTVEDGTIVAIDILADPARLETLDLTFLAH